MKLYAWEQITTLCARTSTVLHDRRGNQNILIEFTLFMNCWPQIVMRKTNISLSWH